MSALYIPGIQKTLDIEFEFMKTAVYELHKQYERHKSHLHNMCIDVYFRMSNDAKMHEHPIYLASSKTAT